MTIMEIPSLWKKKIENTLFQFVDSFFFFFFFEVKASRENYKSTFNFRA